MALRSPKLSLQPALRSIKQQEEVPNLLVSLLQLMAERRELNIQPVMNQKLKTELLEATGFQLFWHEDPEDEQLATTFMT